MRRSAARTLVLAVLLVACGLANPIARSRDGTPARSRMRVGIASALFYGDCERADDCTVQLTMAHAGGRAHHVDIVAVRLIVDGIDVGPATVHDVRHWNHGAYRHWGGTIWPYGSEKLSIVFDPDIWELRLAMYGLEDYRENIRVQVDFAIDDEPGVVRSIFAMQHERERVFVVT